MVFDFFKKKAKGTCLAACADGTVVPMDQIPDAVFSQGIMGVCCGIEPKDGKVYAPADGTVIQLTPTLHAIGLSVGDMEILIHAGIDTVAMDGEGFTNEVREGQAVKQGDLLMTMDLEKVHAAGYPPTIIPIVTTSDDFSSVEAKPGGTVRAGDPLMRVRK